MAHIVNMKNLYEILNLKKDAHADDIKKAYRRLAKEYHPDHNRDDTNMAERFKEISAAYSLLSDPQKRLQYDRGEIDGLGNEKTYSTSSDAGFGSHKASHKTSFDFEEAESIFSDFFKFTHNRSSASSRYKTGARQSDRSDARNYTRDTGASSRESRLKSRGLDITYEILVGFEEALNGSKRQITLNSGKKVNVTIPEGIQSGQVIRLPAQGGDGLGGGEAGDALIEIEVAPHPYYRREGLDILMDLPVSLDEAILGSDIQVPTPKGRITVRIPKASSSGRRLRLKNKGITRRGETGHFYVTLKLVLPEKIDPRLEKAIKEWGGGYGQSLRREAGLV